MSDPLAPANLTPGWVPYLHALRRREIEAVFSWLGGRGFDRALELGAGDGFQSGLLLGRVRRLVASDHEASRLPSPSPPRIACLACDAEAVGRLFRPGSFDLVFSSNLMEHLPDPRSAFEGIREVLAEGGVSVSVMPGPFWKLCQLAFFYPFHLWMALRCLIDPGMRREVRARASGRSPGAPDNNPKTPRPGFWKRHLLPLPHGAYRSHLEEFRTYRRSRWTALITDAGLEVRVVLRMPVSSGYGFRLDRLRRLLERLGLASGYAYVAVKPR